MKVTDKLALVLAIVAIIVSATSVMAASDAVERAEKVTVSTTPGIHTYSGGLENVTVEGGEVVLYFDHATFRFNLGKEVSENDLGEARVYLQSHSQGLYTIVYDDEMYLRSIERVIQD